jgi:hypothetical protein
MQASPEPCVARYRELKNLKLVGAELGIPWQTVYVRLKRAGEPVTGDKARYGSATDRLAARAERWFKRAVPDAEDQNQTAYQAKVDFTVGGLGVDVKVSRPRPTRTGVIQWSWSIKKQEAVADFFVCVALNSRGDDPGVHCALLIPGALARNYTTLRASHDGEALTGKWADYACSSLELRAFFSEIGR